MKRPTLLMRLALSVFAVLTIPASLFAAPPAPPLRIAPSAMHQVQALQAIKTAKTLTSNKIGSRLYLGMLHQRNDLRLAPLTDFRFVTGEADGRVPVDILLTDITAWKPVVSALESLGEVVRTRSHKFKHINARVHLGSLDALAAMPEVRKITQGIPYLTSKVNTSEGDTTHGANLARAFYGVSGTGVKVGVLSDGVDSLAALEASGDLPASVTVLPGQAGSGDEGSAMLEIVHDLAPGAQLFFATADPDESTFAQNIRDLRTAGCDIIVDDVIYLDESPFHDGQQAGLNSTMGIIAQAVNNVTTAGALYFSSAGNEGNQDDLTSGTWQGDYKSTAAADPAPLAGANLHDFGDGGNSILVMFGGGNPPILTWSDPLDTAADDYDLYDMDGGLTTIFDASTDTQDGTGGDDQPFEIIGGGTFSGERLLVDKFAGSGRFLDLELFRGTLDSTLTTSGSTHGHSSTANAFSVAATPASTAFQPGDPTGPYPSLFTVANVNETFSCDGPRKLFYQADGTPFTPGDFSSTGGIVRQKPDITAADGVSCAAPGFSPFFGTSAAAPHAAAIAALLKSAVPSLTPAQIRTALISTAIDIDAAGTDRDSGAGIVMAQAALQSVGATPMAFLSAGTPVPTELIGDGDAFIENNEVWNLSIPITNSGGIGATGISAVLSSSTPGVTFPSNTSAYPDLAVSASGNNTTPFTFIVGPGVLCGSLLQFTLTISYTGGPSPQISTFSIKSGQPGTPVTISYTGPPVPIPDAGDLSGSNPGAPAIATLNVAGVTGAIYDINFSFDGTSCSSTAGSTTVGLDHTFVSDLKITLTSPTGTPVLLINGADSSGNNFCQTVLDDEGGGPSIQSVVSGNAPFTGNFTPNAPLATFNGEAPNGNWQLQAQDFFSGDTGNIRAFSLIITPAVCDAPALTANVSGTKTVSGNFHTGGTVTYTVTLTNTGGLAQADNAGHEFTDVLPASLTLVSANATAGTAVATVGTNTVTWDGALAAINGSVTITITATVKNVAGGTVISNQGTISYDADGNGTNESSKLTDDPGVGGASDPTSFTAIGLAVNSVTDVATGPFSTGSTMTYTLVISNSGNAASGDNPGNELTDVLPATLTLVSANATAGTAVATIGTNTVTWNGSVPAGGSVTITIAATIHAGTEGQTISDQASLSYDGDANGTNETTVLSDDPTVVGASNPTTFVAVSPLPATSAFTLLLLGLSLTLLAFKALKT